jgi:tetratricopeptide (TPR) repeat protein
VKTHKLIIFILIGLLLCGFSCKHGKYTIPTYTPLVREKPNEADRWYNLGIAYCVLGRHKDAVKSLEYALKLDQNDSDALYRLGIEYVLLGKPKEASISFGKALATGKIPPIHSDCGLAYYHTGKFREAIDEFQKGIEDEDKGPVKNYLFIGGAYSQLKMYEQSIESFKKAILTNLNAANEFNVHYYLGAQYYQMKRYKEAVNALQYSIKIHPEKTDSYLFLGEVYADLNNFNDAMLYYKILLNINPIYAKKLADYIKSRSSVDFIP